MGDYNQNNQQMNNRQTSIKSVNVEQLSDDGEQIFIKNLQTGQAQNSKEVIKHHESLLLHDNKKSAWSGYFSSIHKINDKLLSLVIKRNHQQLLEILNQYPVQLSQIKYMDGWSLLHFAVSQNDCMIALVLLKFGINVDIQSSQMQRTALHEACISNKEDMVRLLVQWNADCNIVDAQRNTALHFAVDFGYTDIVKILLKSKTQANLNIRNQMNMTTFNSCRNPEIFQLLITYIQKKKKSSIHSRQTKTSQNIYKQQEEAHDNYESRLVIRNSQVIPHYTRSDMVQKFLSLRDAPVERSERKVDADSIISENSLEDKNSFYLEEPLEAIRKKKSKKLGSRITNANILKSSRKAEQNIGLVRQSIFKTLLIGEQKIENFDFLKKIGEGSFAQVFLVRKKRSTPLYGLKKISKNHIIQRKLYPYFLAQKQILTSINHPFILSAHYCLQNFTHLFIIMDFCPHGDLERIVRQQKLQEDVAGVYSCQVALALQQLHDKGFLYRDLKASNILIDAQGHLKLADFGLAKKAENSQSFLGSMAYLAPQMLVQGQVKPHSKSLDWYLFGLFIYQTLHGFPPFYSQNQQQMQYNIKHQLPIFGSHISEQSKDLMLLLLQKDPNKRISSLDELKKCKWYEKINWQLIYNKQYDVLQFPKLDEKQLRKKEIVYEPEQNEINQKIQWYEDWNYPKSKN